MATRHPGSWRWRVLAIVLPAVLATFGAIALVPRTDVKAATPRIPRANETECLPTGPLNSVDDLNKFATTVRGSSQFLGGDVGADVTLQDGRRLWVFGDTLRAEEGRRRFVRNSMLVFSGQCAQVVLPPDHGALIPDRGDGIGYWPMSIVRTGYPGYDLVGVATQRVRRTSGGGAFDFANLGPSLALFIAPRGQTPQLILQRDLGPDDADPTRPTWGAASAIKDGWIYLYGTARPKRGSFGYSLRVARMRPDDFLEQSKWQYWDGKHWQRKSDRAKVLIPAVGGVSQTLSVFPLNGRWYALSKRDEFLGNDLAVWSAAKPTGPFSFAGTLADIPSNASTGELRYMPLAHPDLLPRTNSNSIIVSYSQNNTDFGKIKNNPFLYRPAFLRVTLP